MSRKGPKRIAVASPQTRLAMARRSAVRAEAPHLGRADVVDGEHAHQPATTPGWKRGSRSTTLVPASGAVSTISP